MTPDNPPGGDELQGRCDGGCRWVMKGVGAPDVGPRAAVGWQCSGCGAAKVTEHRRDSMATDGWPEGRR